MAEVFRKGKYAAPRTRHKLLIISELRRRWSGGFRSNETDGNDAAPSLRPEGSRNGAYLSSCPNPRHWKSGRLQRERLQNIRGYLRDPCRRAR
jgi:hypothetical protein